MDANEQDGSKIQQAKAKYAQTKEKVNEKVAAGAEKVETGAKKTDSAVATGVAAVKGVLTGLTGELEKQDLGASAKGAIEGTANLAREVGQTGAQETRKTKDELTE